MKFVFQQNNFWKRISFAGNPDFYDWHYKSYPDPLAELFTFHSPYSYAFNNPVNWRDPSGLAPEKAGSKDRILDGEIDYIKIEDNEKIYYTIGVICSAKRASYEEMIEAWIILMMNANDPGRYGAPKCLVPGELFSGGNNTNGGSSSANGDKKPNSSSQRLAIPKIAGNPDIVAQQDNISNPFPLSKNAKYYVDLSSYGLGVLQVVALEKAKDYSNSLIDPDPVRHERNSRPSNTSKTSKTYKGKLAKAAKITKYVKNSGLVLGVATELVYFVDIGVSVYTGEATAGSVVVDVAGIVFTGFTMSGNPIAIVFGYAGNAVLILYGDEIESGIDDAVDSIWENMYPMLQDMANPNTYINLSR